MDSLPAPAPPFFCSTDMGVSNTSATHFDVVCIGNMLICGNQSFHPSLEARSKPTSLNAMRRLHIDPFDDASTCSSCTSAEVWHGMVMSDRSSGAIPTILKKERANLKRMAAGTRSRIGKLLYATVNGAYSLRGALPASSIPSISYKELLQRFGSPTVSVLRIELPGFEEQVVKSMLEACKSAEWLCPSVVAWRHGRLHHKPSFVTHRGDSKQETLTGAAAPAFLRNANRLKRHGFVAASDCFVRVAPKELRRPAGQMDFVEVGTSDFDHIIGQVHDDASGLSIEAMPFYAEVLPFRRGVQRVNAAIVGATDEAARTGHVMAHYVHPDNITRYGIDARAKGCSTIGAAPSSCAHTFLLRRNLTHLMEHRRVPATSFASLLSQRGVRSIGLLKVDVEGFEAQVFDSLIDACTTSHPQLWPRVVIWEQIRLPKSTQRRLAAAFERHGYFAAREPDSDRVYVRVEG